MRQQPSGGSYAAGTKIDAHRSRVELEQLLARYGATDFVVLEHDANATIRFALHGKYVQYVLPLPEFEGPAFTHTPTGRPRRLAAHERAYEQAVRQQWRRAVLVMKGKLEAIESGLSPFEREFYGAIQDDDRREKPAALLLRRRLRWAPETMLVILCLGVLVPAGGAVALGVPAVAVEHLAGPALGDAGDPHGRPAKDSSSGGQTLRLAAAPSSAGAAHAASPGGTQLVAESTGGSGSGGNGKSDGPSGGSVAGGDPEPAGGHSASPDNPGQGQGKPDNPGQGNGQPDTPGNGNGNGNGQPGSPSNGNGNGNGQAANPGNGNAYGQDKPDQPGQGQGKPNAGGGADQAQSQAPNSGPANGQDKSQGEQNGKGAGGPANGKK